MFPDYPRRLLLLCLLPAFAQAADEPALTPEVELDPLVIQSSPLPNQTPLDMAQPATVLDSDDLRSRRANTIGETVANEPGVSASDFGGGASRPVIRGLDAPRVRVLENGIGTFDASSISADHVVAAEPFGAEQVEILRGPATLLYGSGAIGGVVNVVTNRVPMERVDGIHAETDVHYGSVSDELQGAAQVNAGAGPLALHLDALGRDTNDYFIPKDARDDAGTFSSHGRLNNSALDSSRYTFGSSYVTDKGLLGLAYGRTDTQYQIPGEEPVFIQAGQDRYDLKGMLNSPGFGLERIKFDFGHGDYTHTEFEAPGVPGTVYNNREYETRVEFVHQPIAGVHGAFGLQHRDRNVSAEGDEAFLPPSHTWSLGAFAVEEYALTKTLKLSAGARVEHQTSETDFALPMVDNLLLSGSTGLVYEFTPGYSASVSYTRAARAPEAQELYALGPHLATLTYEIGQTNLREEIAHNLDLSLRKSQGRVQFTFNLYANFINDYVYQGSLDTNGDGVADRYDLDGNLDPAGDLLAVRYAQRDAQFLGAEFETLLRILQHSPVGDVDLRLFGDYVRGRFADGGNLPRITPPRLGAGLIVHRGALDMQLQAMRVLDQTQQAALETETSGYTLLDLYAGYKLGFGHADHELYLKGTNLLDEELRRHTSFLKNSAPLPGRGFLIGFRSSF